MIKEPKLPLVAVLLYNAESLLNNSEIDMARYCKENSLAYTFVSIINNLISNNFGAIFKHVLKHDFFIQNFLYLRSNLMNGVQKKGLLVSKDSNAPAIQNLSKPLMYLFNLIN